MHYAANLLTKAQDLRVFMVWVTDSDTFSACPSIIQTRLQGMDIKNIQRSLKNMVKLGLLEEDGWGYVDEKRFKKYRLKEPVEATAKEPLEATSTDLKEPLEAGIPSNLIPTNKPTKAGECVESSFDFKELEEDLVSFLRS